MALPGVAAAAFASRLRGSKCPIACSVAGFALGALVGVMLASVAFALWSDGRGPGTDLPASTIVAVAFLAGVPLGGIPGAALGWSVGTWLAEQPALRPRRGKDDR